MQNSKLPEPLNELRAFLDRIKSEADPLRKAILATKSLFVQVEQSALQYVLDQAANHGIHRISISENELVSVDFDYKKTPHALWDLAEELGITSEDRANYIQSPINFAWPVTDRMIGRWDTKTKEYLGEPDSFWY